MYIPTFSEFLWASSRFIDVVVEVPQLKMVYVSDRLDKWIIAYYYCIGSQVFVYTLRLVYRFVVDQNDAPVGELIRLHSTTFLALNTQISTISSRLGRRFPKGS